VIRGERLIKLGKSWFSVKDIEVSRDMYNVGVEHWMGLGWLLALLSPTKLRILLLAFWPLLPRMVSFRCLCFDRFPCGAFKLIIDRLRVTRS